MEAQKFEPVVEAPPVHLPAGTEDVIRESKGILRLAEMIEVDGQESYEYACENIIEWKDAIKARESWFKPIKQAWDAAKKIVLDKEKEAVGPLQRAIGIVEPKAIKWKQDQEAKANAERLRLGAIERQKEEDRRVAEAARLEKAGQAELAQLVLETPMEVARVVVPAPVQKVMGLPTTKRWDFEIVDSSAIKRLYLEPDETKIRKQVVALGKEAEALVGGIRVFQKEGFTRR